MYNANVRKTNPQTLATPTLVKETQKDVISPISRLINLCNRRKLEKIIWRGVLMHFPLLSSCSCSFPHCFSQWKQLFFPFTSTPWKQMIFIPGIFVVFVFFWAPKALALLCLVLTALWELRLSLLQSKTKEKDFCESVWEVWFELFQGGLRGCVTAGLLFFLGS